MRSANTVHIVNQSPSGSVRNTRSTSTTSVPACARRSTAAAHTAAISASTSHPHDGAHTTLAGNPRSSSAPGPRGLRWWQGEGIGGIGTDAHVEGVDQVADAPGHRTPHAEPPGAWCPNAADRDAPVGGLQAGEAARRGGDPDRTRRHRCPWPGAPSPRPAPPPSPLRSRPASVRGPRGCGWGPGPGWWCRPGSRTRAWSSCPAPRTPRPAGAPPAANRPPPPGPGRAAASRTRW